MFSNTYSRDDPQKSLCDNAREDIQQMFSRLLQLPVSRPPEGMNGVVVDLPKPTTVIPREKPIPKVAPKTKWEKFAEAKGIVKRKRGRMLIDENTGEIRPRFGYKR